MNYQKLYTSLISKAKQRERIIGYYETHHIVPKALGGTNNKNNLVDLSAREHCIAHLLLAKIHGGPMWHAANMMLINGKIKSSRLYAAIRKHHAEQMSGTLSPNFKGSIQATNILTNEIKILSGRKEIETWGFCYNSVRKCIGGFRKSHKGFIFGIVH